MARTKRGSKALKNLRHERYARGRANGRTKADAARRAGASTKRANRTGYQWEQREEVRKRIEHLVKEQMDVDEVKGRLAAMARGVIPTKETVGSGRPRAEFDMVSAADKIAKLHHLYADDAPPTGSLAGGSLVLPIPPDKLVPLAQQALKVLAQSQAAEAKR